MLRLRNFVIASLTLCCLLLPAMADTKKQNNAVDLYVYLNQEGIRLNSYFTVEDQVDPGESVGTDILVESDPTVATSDALIKKLQKEQSTYSVIKDEENPRIIHLVDKRLFSQPKYYLNKKANIAYSGRLNDLPDKIGQQLHFDLAAKNEFAIGSESIVEDSTTQVAFDAKNLSIRSILTDYIPLKNYSRLLWRAQTSDNGRQLHTRISYYGQLPAQAKSDH